MVLLVVHPVDLAGGLPAKTNSGKSCGWIGTLMAITSTDIIGLEGWRATARPKPILKKINDQMVTVNRIPAVHESVLTECPECQAAYPDFRKNGHKIQTFKHSQVHGAPAEIKLSRQRYRCKTCKAVGRDPYTFLQPLTDVDEHRRVTTAFMANAKSGSVVFTKAILHVADELGMSDRMARNIQKEHSVTLQNVPPAPVSSCIGIDECHLADGEHAVFFDIIHKRPIALLDLRNKELVKNSLKRIPGWEGIRAVVIDQHRPYWTAIQASLPGAVIVNDRFHVTDMASRCANRVRTAVRQPLTLSVKRNVLPDHRVMYCRRQNLTKGERDAFAACSLNYPEIERAYDLKEGFLELYNLGTSAEALRQYAVWANRLAGEPKVIQECFEELLTAMATWKKEVFNYIEYPYTNGHSERTNRFIKDLDRKGCSLDVIRMKLINKKYREKRRAPATRKDASGATGKKKQTSVASNTKEAPKPKLPLVFQQSLFPLYPRLAESECPGCCARKKG